MAGHGDFHDLADRLARIRSRDTCMPKWGHALSSEQVRTLWGLG
jgi:hypothetical protein